MPACFPCHSCFVFRTTHVVRSTPVTRTHAAAASAFVSQLSRVADRYKVIFTYQQSSQSLLLARVRRNLERCKQRQPRLPVFQRPATPNAKQARLNTNVTPRHQPLPRRSSIPSGVVCPAGRVTFRFNLPTPSSASASQCHPTTIRKYIPPSWLPLQLQTGHFKPRDPAVALLLR